MVIVMDYPRTLRTSDVRSATAGASAGAVGTYALLTSDDSNDTDPGATRGK